MTDPVTLVVNIVVASVLVGIPALFALTAWRERGRERRRRNGTDDRLTVLTTGIATIAVLSLARAQADWGQLPVALWFGAVTILAVAVAGEIRRWPDLPWATRRSRWRVAKTSTTLAISVAVLALSVSG